MTDELLTPGKGKFKIKIVKTHDADGVCLETKKGDRKVMLVVEVIDCNGKKGTVFEHLTMNIPWKVEAICKACDAHHLFESDATCLDKLDNLEGCMGECIVGRQEADGQWPEKSTVAKYITPKNIRVAPPAPSMVESFFEDDIPF